MSLRLKLVTIILFVALVPLAVSSITSLRVHQRAFDEQLRDRQRNVAVVGANIVRDYFSTTTRQLRVAATTVRWEKLNADERRGALWLIFGQSADVSAVALLDHRGQGVAPSVYMRSIPPNTAPADIHPVATDALLAALAKHIPFTQAVANGTAVGEVFRVAGRNHPTIPVAVRVSGPDATPWVVVASVSLRSICNKLEGMRGTSLVVHLIDKSGHGLCGPSQIQAPNKAALALNENGSAATHTYKTPDGTAMLAAVAPVSNAGGGDWRVIAEQPRAIALAPGRQMRNQSLYWLALGVIVALGTGLLLARGISRPIAKLVQGATRLADGKFDQRIEVTSRDELGRLSRTFNHMSDEIERRDAEIRAWNAELQERVDTRTKQLANAQTQLLQSQKIAAVATLGAGIAHEINNPLTTVIGGTQLVRTKLERSGDKKLSALLDAVESDAKRIKAIVQTMLNFSRDQDDATLSLIDVNALLDRTLELTAAQNKDAGISVSRDYARDLPSIRGNDTRLSQAFLHVLSNAISAMTGAEGTIFITTRQPQDKLIELTIRDTGKGMPADILDKIFDPFFTTKDEWTKQGLGLTEAHRIVSEHHGTIRAESEVGVGTSIIIHLPQASLGAHLV